MKNKTNKNKKYIWISVIGLIIGFLIFGMFYDQPSIEQGILNKYGLNGLSVEEMVFKLDSSQFEEKDFNAKITSEMLILEKGENQFNYDLPEDKFYVSIAPYINDTHTCEIHNLKTCKSELANKIFEVTIKDKKDNVVYFDNVNSMANGFIGIWLPKDIEGTIQVKYNEYRVTSNISTYNNDNTCITTPLQLK